MTYSKPIPISIFKNQELIARFCLWQRSQTNHGQVGRIHSAAEFSTFCKHENVLDFGRNFDARGRHIATKCGHLLHPSAKNNQEYCPVCEVVVYLDLLHLISEAWDEEGGPWSKRPTKLHTKFLCAWHKTRLELEEQVATFENVADHEARWETEHPEDAATARKTLSATNAIVVARVMSQYPAVVTSCQIPDALYGKLVTPPATPGAKKTKKVTFASNTNFEPGRFQGEYNRKHQDYEEGSHAAIWPQEWADTSNMTARLYNVRQLKVASNPQGQRLYDLLHDLAIDDHEGIAELHPRWREVRTILKAQAGDEGTETRTELFKDLEQADYLLLAIENGEVTEAVPHATFDIEDLKDEPEAVEQNNAALLEVHVQPKSWTSLSEILPKSLLAEIKHAYEEPDEDCAATSRDPADAKTHEHQQKKGPKKRSAVEDLDIFSPKRPK